MRQTSRLGSVLLVLATWCAPSIAFADDAPAAAIKKRGDDAIESGRPADALAAYTEAYALSKDPALLYNKSRAFEALTEYPSALVELEAFDRAAPPEMKARVPGLAQRLVDLRRRVVTVTLTCDVDGAQIRIRDRTVGTCPLPGAITLNAGKARVEVTADGYFPFQRDADLPGGGAAVFDVHLVSKARTGILVVRSNGPSVDVAIDGKAVGTAPVEANLESGAHTLGLTRPGYRPVQTSAVIRAGERHEVEIPLAAEPGVLGRWWFWTGAAVVLAAGVTTFVLLRTEKDPEPGTVPPGIVRAGLSAPGFRF